MWFSLKFFIFMYLETDTHGQNGRRCKQGPWRRNEGTDVKRRTKRKWKQTAREGRRPRERSKHQRKRWSSHDRIRGCSNTFFLCLRGTNRERSHLWGSIRSGLLLFQFFFCCLEPTLTTKSNVVKRAVTRMNCLSITIISRPPLIKMKISVDNSRLLLDSEEISLSFFPLPFLFLSLPLPSLYWLPLVSRNGLLCYIVICLDISDPYILASWESRRG